LAYSPVTTPVFAGDGSSAEITATAIPVRVFPREELDSVERLVDVTDEMK